MPEKKNKGKYPRKTLQVSHEAWEKMQDIFEHMLLEGSKDLLKKGVFTPKQLSDFLKRPTLISCASACILKFEELFFGKINYGEWKEYKDETG
jgi:hypothetical protein